jgi:hypothetical protein
MYLHPGEWSNPGEPRLSEARSIGAILGDMHEIAVLRTGPRGDRRNLSLRRNSA